ncbi:hypothetical protein [Laceyella tengchongensis]|uniref:hypothetical protein n=1 Tax=Laceyella tengchongensis TaxID=574699 RepID=UPI0012B95F3C|nr:hypothetical protein [Laceyella tengchongensis]
MDVSKQDLYDLIDRLDPREWKAAHAFLLNLVQTASQDASQSQKRRFYAEIEKKEAVVRPISEREMEQMSGLLEQLTLSELQAELAVPITWNGPIDCHVLISAAIVPFCGSNPLRNSAPSWKRWQSSSASHRGWRCGAYLGWKGIFS